MNVTQLHNLNLRFPPPSLFALGLQIGVISFYSIPMVILDFQMPVSHKQKSLHKHAKTKYLNARNFQTQYSHTLNTMS